MTRRLVLAIAVVCSAGFFAVTAAAQDFFDDFTTFHDYTDGTVPAGGIWSGIHNATNGSGVGGVPEAFFQANGQDAFGTPKPGLLFIEDLNGGPSGAGVGWEGTRTSAPFLFRDVPATEDFDAKMKIDAQTAGNWSSVGVLARLKGPAVGETIDPGENFVSGTSFRTDAANPDNATILTKRIQNGAQVTDAQTNFTDGSATPTPPVYVRMTKQGTTFTTQSSLNGSQWFTETVVQAPELGSGTLEVGLHFQMFGAGQGEVDIDWFDLFVGSQPPTDFLWTQGGAGSWATTTNWQTNTIPGAPSSNVAVVRFEGAIAAPATVYTDSDVTAKQLQFDSANKYAIAGTGILTLEADSGNAGIQVAQGSHEIQTQLVLNSTADFSAATGGRLDINNRLNLNGQTLNTSGDGVVSINNNLDSGTTGLVANTGTLQGSGTINGDLQNDAGGTVSPGNSPGTLTVDGTYTQAAGSSLLMEIGGTSAGTYDTLSVGGAFTAGGTFDIDLINGFNPVAGNSWDLLDFASANGSFTFSLPTLGSGLNWDTSNLLTTGALSVTSAVGINADFNNDDIVDGRDFLIWQQNLGATGATNSQGDSNGDGKVDATDLANWQAHFGQSSAEVVSVAVPEPAAWILLGFAGMFGGVTRRWK